MLRLRLLKDQILMKFDEQLDTFLRARFPLILVVSQEEERVLQILKNLCDRTQRALLSWDFSDGFRLLSGSEHKSAGCARPADRAGTIGSLCDRQIPSSC